MFTNIKFRLFEQQVNGGERETCDILINGVPFSSANNASRINGGLEIIKVLSENKDVNVPVFIDNAESVTNIFDTNSQQVLMYVDDNYPTLNIN